MLSTRHLTLLLLALLHLPACGQDDNDRTCSRASDCLQAGIAGECLPSPLSSASWCAFRDDDCDNDLRWGLLTGDDLAAQCVDGVAIDAGTPDAAAVDAAPRDASVPDAAILADAASSCTCVGKVPESWHGPVAVYDGEVSADVPDCPSDYPIGNQDLNGELQATGGCSCSCGTPTGVDCLLTFHEYTDSECSPASDRSTIKRLKCSDECGPWDNWDIYYRQAVSVLVTDGQCAASAIDALVPTSWNKAMRSCGPAALSVSDCAGEEICAPALSDGFELLCVWSEGEVACPDGSPYSQRMVRYGGFTDNRSCSGCECGPVVGELQGSLRFAAECGGSPAQSRSFDSCSIVPTEYATVDVVEDVSNLSCAASEGSVEGAVELTGAVTLCCLP